MFINKVMEARFEEIVDEAVRRVENSPVGDRVTDYIFTGGGIKMGNSLKYLQRKYHNVVTIGVPGPIYTVSEDVKKPEFIESFGTLTVACSKFHENKPTGIKKFFEMFR